MKRDKIAVVGAASTGSRTPCAKILRAAACAGLAIVSARAVRAGEPERVLEWSALKNGGFEEKGGPASPPAIPWWRSTNGSGQIETDGTAGSRLRTAKGEHAEQPIAGYAPLVDRLRVTGRVVGAGVVSIVDGTNAVARFPVRSTDGATAAPFSITAADLARELGHPPTPRLLVRFAGDGDATAHWDDLDVVVGLPLPDEAHLRDEVIAQLDAIFTAWEERALDDVGPRKTAFAARGFDVVTGAAASVQASAHPTIALHENLLDAVLAHDEPRWRAFLERYLDDLLELGLHPATGLPCAWNPTTDARIEDQPIEIGLTFGFLLDVAREGPERYRARALAAAEKIGETVLAHGLLPDGDVAASYVPRTGVPNVDVSALRRLDVPCQLARLSAATADARYVEPVRDALAALEYANHWTGTWNTIDPSFDDDFGHYAARATTIASALPEDLLFRRFALEGIGHFLPLWKDATRFGGNVAADQVRCWRLVADLARVEPRLRAELEPVLRDAVHAHFLGEQYGNGAWGDVTIFGFAPNPALQVGDLPGTPQNLLNGLAAAYTADLGLRTELTRAMYAAVLRSTVTEYGRPYGFLLGRAESERGGNSAAGSLRVLLGLTTMLRGLSNAR